ncbi:hypothetical protein FKM82_025205 [Ascaphus truei]
MSWAALLLAVTSLCACSSAQLPLTQPPSVTVSPGGTARLSCVFSSEYISAKTAMRWIQLRPGIAPPVGLSLLQQQ